MPAPPDVQNAAVVQASTLEEEPGFLEKMWPLWLDEDLDPLVARGLWSFWVGGFIPFVPFGNVWLPMLVIDAPYDAGSYILDALLIGATHLLPHCLVFPVAFVVIFAGTFGAIAAGGSAAFPIVIATFIGGYGLLAANGVCMAVNGLWCMPVAMANAFDRAVDNKRASFRRRASEAPARGGPDLAMAY